MARTMQGDAEAQMRWIRKQERLREGEKIVDIADKLRSQIGDDVRYLFDHEALFKGALEEILRLRSKIDRMSMAIKLAREEIECGDDSGAYVTLGVAERKQEGET